MANTKITTNVIADDAITSAKLDTNIAIAGTLGVTGNITGTLATAAQTNITSVGTLTALTGGTGDLNWDSGTLFVDSSANAVGIGTTSPQGLIDLTVSQAKTTTSGATFAQLGKTNESSGYAALQCEVKGGASAAVRKWEFQTIEQGVANAGSIVFQPNGGNVAIGNTSPAFENGTGLEIRYAGGNGAHLKLTDNASGTGATQGFDLYMFNSQAYIENYENAPTIFRNNGEESARFDASGNIGIGTGTIANESDHKKLKISGASGTGAGIIEFADGSNNIDGAIFSDDGNLFIVADRDNATADSSIRFRVDGSSEKMRIDSSGDVRLGANATGAALIKGVSGDQADRDNSGYPQYTFVGNEGTGMRRVSSNILAFDSSGAERMRIKSDGQITTQGDILPGADVIMANGRGISFAATANSGGMASELLDDYEEGTWTPSFQSDGSTSYTARVGTYTKVGNLVTAWFHIDINSNGATSSQSLIIAGLPFAAINTTENYGSTGGLHCNQWSTSTKPDNALISAGANVASLYKSNGQAGIEVPTHAAIGGGNMLGFLIYRAT